MATENTPPRDYLNDDKFMSAWAQMDPVLRRECLRMEREIKEGTAIMKDRAVGRPKRDLTGFYGLELRDAEAYRVEQTSQNADEIAASRARADALRQSLAADEAKWQHILALDEFHDMAEASGKKLADVLRGYIDMEQLIRADLIEGIFTICDQGGVDPFKLLAAVLNTPDPRAAH